MRPWPRPTLVRRVFLSLLAASCVIWIATMSLILADNLGHGKTSEELTSLSGYLVDGLAGIDEPGAARAFVLGAIGETHRDAYNWRNFKLIKMQLTDRGGRVLLSNLRKGEPPLAGAAGRIDSIRQGRMLLARGDTARWTIHIALPQHDFTGILRDDWLSLTLTILIAFPIIFIPVWLAIATGMRPLRQMSERIAARGADDLSPLGFDPQYAEMKPLAASIDSLLLQLRNKISREQAFVQDAAHELRTPIAVISAQTHVMSMASSERDRREAEEQMDQAIARSAHLITQLLDLAKLDGKPAQPGVTLDLARLLRQDLAQRAPLALAKGVGLSLEAPDALMARLEPQALRSVLHNLVDNALRYVGPGGRVAVGLSQAHGRLTLSVEDDGPGIAPELRELVFERFYRCAGNDASGAGLGLAIARQAAARLDGTLRLGAGAGGRGCLFTLTI
ncbi:sensor histidine kinase [Massilia glaciei]|uniref:histidine kinase n=1 Tax=Massilia glaciei TaxID=1524097 RepID=A0A2U2HLS2_9BURK|nr:ATP-binding protein [Massilia glaciei]PWF48464.1 two-component sensor histidine kinase [Massilia glaciei]